ncbi:MAG: translational GTPase TypA [Gemmatimonadetes bacterium]|nr:translational GTPase TypA [Gemmatimonadota bacterium]
MNIRNVAIIAHVDHGKTTLVDQLLQQGHLFRSNQVMAERFLDSNPLERERGITILSKNISIPYAGVKINLIDTPGHADFGGEVERVLKMADGVLLLVDAFEGPMPQTRFVLQKALELHLKPVVVINKVDRHDSRADEVLEEIFDLFVELEAADEQLDFPTVYASGREGWATLESGAAGTDLTPLLDTILEHVPAPPSPEGPVQMLVTTLDYSEYVGRIAIGRVFRGTLAPGPVTLLKRDGSRSSATIRQLLTFEGLEREPAERVPAGDLCAVVGVEEAHIGDTIADAEAPEPLPMLAIDEPTVMMTFTVNTSPFYGREGKFVTSRHLADRLAKELERDVALRVEPTHSPDTFRVSGRGILHLSILIERMRREGYEMQVGQPKVIYKEIGGKKCEPIEILAVDVPEEHQGRVIEMVSQRRGELQVLEPRGAQTHMEFRIPSRGLIGLRSRMLLATSGEATMHHRFFEYEHFKGSVPERQMGALVSMAEGDVVGYALDGLQDRGRFFVDPGEPVYTGQVVGETPKEDDIVVNVQKSKKLTNMRASGADKALKITPAIKFSLEEALEYINHDEMVEVTPKSIRLRKILLDENARKRARTAARLEGVGV